MITLVSGRAGSGKTAYVINELKQRMQRGETELYMVVPEQYSHNAERQVSEICGAVFNLHGEVLSFTRLSGKVLAETGGAALNLISDGGLILMMYRVLDALQDQLEIFSNKRPRTDFIRNLLATVKELKSYSITSEQLLELAGKAETVGSKLRDMALVLQGFDSLLGAESISSGGRLALIPARIKSSTLGNAGEIFFDGFNGFTVIECRIIEELAKKGSNMTFVLTLDSDAIDEEVFSIPQKTMGMLKRIAQKYGAEIKEIKMTESSQNRAAELAFLEKHLFSHNSARYEGECRNISIYKADSKYGECVYAAGLVQRLVRDGYRWRDIGIISRAADEYSRMLENVFEQYGIPLFVAGKTDILQKPPVALILSALEAVNSGWEYGAVFKYLKTGITGILPEDCNILENYCVKWNIRGSFWTRNKDWAFTGYTGAEDSDSAELVRINELRRKVSAPLLRLERDLKNAVEANDKLTALYRFLEQIEFQAHLREKSEALLARGEMRLSNEYAQIWDILKDVFEQFFTTMQGLVISNSEFHALLMLSLSQYDVSVIPIALDRVAFGDMTGNRRRDYKCVIVLGATDDLLPKPAENTGVLSDAERDELALLAPNMPESAEIRLLRELNTIYSTLVMPERELIFTYRTDENKRASIYLKRLEEIFGITAQSPEQYEFMTYAPGPCVELAGLASNGSGGVLAYVASEYFKNLGQDGNRLFFIDEILRAVRRDMTSQSASMLYGKKAVLSASRIDKFYACKFSHFLQSGLKARAQKRAEFDAPAAGTFMHYVLENVTREIKDTVGFLNASDDLSMELTEKYITTYITDICGGFTDKSGRFIFLFNRLCEDLKSIVLDMVGELRNSDFIPLDFELKFDEAIKIDGNEFLRVRGIIDRVDGCEIDGKLYMRIVDYKTGKRRFSLSDIWYGLGMQMLLYLFTLSRGDERTIPAGVIYAPVREDYVKASKDISPEELKKLRERGKQRSGLLLDDIIVLEAMERGEKKYLPVKVTKSGVSGESLADLEKFSRLAAHVDTLLKQMSDELCAGAVRRDPYYKNETDNACLYCDYHTACHFSEELGDEKRYLRKLKTDEVWERLEDYE